MAYSHQARMKAAQGKLHPFGYSDRKRRSSEVGEDLGGAMMGLRRPPKTEMTEEEKRKHFIDSYNQQSFQQAYQHSSDMARDQWTKEALAQDRSNKLAERAMIGGEYTVKGLDAAHQEADKNAQDRLLIKSMIQQHYGPRIPLGIGGTPSPYSLGPGAF